MGFVKNKNSLIIFLAFINIILISYTSHAYDTVGINIKPYNFNQEKIIEISWKADILEYESNKYPNTNIIPLRIEFNSLEFNGEKGGISMGVMIQNLLHKYEEASCIVDSMPGGLELYFSVMDQNLLDDDPTNDIIGGVKLDANPNLFPSFRRIFQDIDGLSIVGNNIYANDAVVVPDKQIPSIIEWNIKRGSLVTNPIGNFHKNINCQWQELQGEYREWIFSIKINGLNYPVGTFYLPEIYASYLNSNNPIILHQEYFSSCNSRLNINKGLVEYYDFKVLSESLTNPVGIPNWKTHWKIDDECGNNDLRYGFGTITRDNKKRILTSVGHEEDINLNRQIGFVLDGIDEVSSDFYTIYPRYNERLTNPKVNFQWNSYPNTDHYLINIRPDNDIGQSGGYVWGITKKNKFDVDMDFAIPTSNNKYYWAVASVDGNGNIVWTDKNNFILE